VLTEALGSEILAHIAIEAHSATTPRDARAQAETRVRTAR